MRAGAAVAQGPLRRLRGGVRRRLGVVPGGGDDQPVGPAGASALGASPAARAALAGRADGAGASDSQTTRGSGAHDAAAATPAAAC